ncbi:MAG TPA: hypothetical protein VHK01_04550, partial [Lacipirellulaceae bacterium]|nr:hypothetical protein [Lacipirellulaceae bacterium]
TLIGQFQARLAQTRAGVFAPLARSLNVRRSGARQESNVRTVAFASTVAFDPTQIPNELSTKTTAQLCADVAPLSMKGQTLPGRKLLNSF